MKKLLLIAILVLGGYVAYDYFGHHRHEHKEHSHGHDEHNDEHSEHTEINDEARENLKIEILKAGKATISEKLKLNGSVILNQNQTAIIKARFAGVVKSVNRSVGDTVKADEVLATIESDESLQVYPIKSPINGVILERNVNVGNKAAEEPVFIVADLGKLWAEFHIFSKDVNSISEGQKIIISRTSNNLITESTITSILPVAENSSQTLVARAEIDNSDNKWKPGFTIRGDVITAETEVPVAVKVSAIQKMEGEKIVFIKHGKKYEKTPITIGTSNDEWAEVTSGISEDDEYVADGSFIIKADMEKSSAEHEH